jgi:hypothetical protein
VAGVYASNINVYYGGSNVNETDEIVYACVPYISGWHPKAYSFNPETRTTAEIGYVNNKQPNSPKGAPKIWTFWNNSDVWNIVFAWETGTGVEIYCYNATSPTLTLAWNYKVISTSNDYMWDIVYTGNGTYVWMGSQLTGSYYFGWPYFSYYNPDTDDKGPNDRIKDEGYWGMWQIGLSNYDNDWIQVLGFNYNTDEYSAFAGPYWEDTTYFTGTEVNYFAEDYDVGNTFRYVFSSNMPYQLYPRLESNYTQLGATLGFPVCSFVDYDSGDTNNDLWVDFNTTWPGVRGWTYWPPEAPEEPETPDGSFSDWTWWGDAACISSVMIIAVVLLVGFIIIQATTRR